MQLSPLSHSKWNYTTAAHLANRAGFGGKPSEIEHLVKIGPDKAVDWYVDYEKESDTPFAPEWATVDGNTEYSMMADFRKIAQQEKEPNLTDAQRQELL